MPGPAGASDDNLSNIGEPTALPYPAPAPDSIPNAPHPHVYPPAPPGGGMGPSPMEYPVQPPEPLPTNVSVIISF